MATSSYAFFATLRPLPTRLPPLPVSPSSCIPLTSQSIRQNPRLSAIGSNRVSAIGVNSKKFRFKLKASAAEMSTEKEKGNFQVFDSEEDLAVSLAKYTADLSDKFTKERGAFTVVLSGGSLIKSLRN